MGAGVGDLALIPRLKVSRRIELLKIFCALKISLMALLRVARPPWARTRSEAARALRAPLCLAPESSCQPTRASTGWANIQWGCWDLAERNARGGQLAEGAGL